ncbi:pyridoxal-phosphate dependent enzyme [Acrocarpospora macrocephala]|uniref:Threonine synthase n=1 Tax=Acrocarpospora macrocephala TaxID=150177 RepID=A0A5M3XDD2_9ACTN|nr:pyridoxal-phosphate dependent enzyme [Acrocarpospora macrocephala]GES16933.1 threonine synthase [Acrocarpospora macrocephala]
MLTPYECRCGRSYAPAADRWRCDCGGLLDLPLAAVAWPPRAGTSSIWRYLDAGDLPWREITLGEGGTPLVEEDGGLHLKVEFASPTGSFKDRGAVVLVALARALGAARLIADSSGNAGTAVAAYAARAGVAAEIFVPAGTSEKKLLQIRGHGAEVTVVEGSREDTAAAAVARVEQSGAFYASHVYNPYFHEGTKTYALEIFEQLGGAVPATLVLPAGNGTLVLGAHRGFAELRAAALIDRVPRIVAVQAERCAPLAAAWAAGLDEPGPVRPGRTLAEGIAIADPARGSRILAAVRDTGGAFVTVGEDEIAAASAALAARGLWVEPTGAVSYAAVRRLRGAESPLLTGGPVVAPLCGSGLKASL